MNIRLLVADLVLHHLEEQHSISREFLLEDEEFNSLFARMINGKLDSEYIERNLSAYIQENF